MQCNLRAFNGKTPRLGERVYVDPAATLIGDITCGDDVSFWPGAVVRGDMHWIRIGHRSNVQDNAVLHITHASEQFNPDGYPLDIGDDVIIGHSAVLHGCTVQDRVLIGIGAIVNDGAVIESETVVGAGCVVPPGKRLEGGKVYVGNPAKPLRDLSAKEREFLGYSPQNYVKLKNQYLNEKGEQ